MSNVLKGRFVAVSEEDGKLVIDSNTLMEKRIEELSKYVGGDGNASADGFSEGLFAEHIEVLPEEAEEGAEPSAIAHEAPPTEPSVDAQALADEIIANANAQAEAIVADANAQAEGIKNAAMAEGRQAGFDAGMQEVEAMKEELNNKAAALDAEYEQRVEELEPVLVDTLTGIYEHIFHVNFSDQKAVIFALAQDALRSVDGGRNMIIHVSESDYGFVSMQKKELLEGVSGADTAEIISDATLKANECYIETESGIFDCSLETQLAGLKREIRLLSYTKDEE
ncbi:MAG: hypothetical protein K5985_01250 [Lachnospiraceae bacterium]|nr:hypothetical protein [Lachnospiraceae bacterium]